jgi:hypothetical protein
MSDDFLVLEKMLRSDLDALDEIYRKLGDAPIRNDEPENVLIVKAYHLHNLYNACENMLASIARAFENHIEDRSRWHSHLLQRMKLDLLPLRPAVLDEATFDRLDELRRFRHFFRTAYGVDLDPERFALAYRKGLELRELLPPKIEEFLDFLQSLSR